MDVSVLKSKDILAHQFLFGQGSIFFSVRETTHPFFFFQLTTSIFYFRSVRFRSLPFAGEWWVVSGVVGGEWWVRWWVRWCVGGEGVMSGVVCGRWCVVNGVMGGGCVSGGWWVCGLVDGLWVVGGYVPKHWEKKIYPPFSLFLSSKWILLVDVGGQKKVSHKEVL
jgi:hypothetical protein